MGWIKQKEDSNLPTWLTENLNAMCECGGDIENFYNDNGAVTSRRCSNPICPYHMAEKVVGMCDILKVKGIGSAKALAIIKSNGLKSHFEAIPFIVSDKPRVTLYDFLRITFIGGIDKGWGEVTDKCSTLDEVFTKYNGNLRDIINENKEALIHGAEYVNIAKPNKLKYKPLVTGNIMISGVLRGYQDRELYPVVMAIAFEGLVQLNVCGKRKTGVMALIQEADTPNRGKAEVALENGIPIMTPDEFLVYIKGLLAKALETREVELADD